MAGAAGRRLRAQPGRRARGEPGDLGGQLRALRPLLGSQPWRTGPPGSRPRALAGWHRAAGRGRPGVSCSWTASSSWVALGASSGMACVWSLSRLDEVGAGLFPLSRLGGPCLPMTTPLMALPPAPVPAPLPARPGASPFACPRPLNSRCSSPHHPRPSSCPPEARLWALGLEGPSAPPASATCSRWPWGS